MLHDARLGFSLRQTRTSLVAHGGHSGPWEKKRVMSRKVECPPLSRHRGSTQRALLDAVSRKIARRLEASCTGPADLGRPTAAIHRRERGRRLVMEIPEVLLIGATTDATARESFRVRVKARRDRMSFRGPVNRPGGPEKHRARAAAWGLPFQQ